MSVPSILAPDLTRVVETALREVGLTHIAHGDREPVPRPRLWSPAASHRCIRRDPGRGVPGRFDEHGDPIDPPVRFERYEA
jgi:hypothetical protein